MMADLKLYVPASDEWLAHLAKQKDADMIELKRANHRLEEENKELRKRLTEALYRATTT
jgi:hypothetical protein